MRRVKLTKLHKRKRNTWFDYLNIVIMIVLSISILFPFWDMLMRSLSDASGSNALTMVWLPKGFTLASYEYLLKDSAVLHAYGVTIARTVVGTLVSLTVTILGAYPLSKKDLPDRNLFTALMVFTMFFGGGLIPTYLLNRSLGLVDNFLVYILPGALGVYNLTLVRNYLMTIDKGLEESAFIDGANYWSILIRVILPLTKPILATITLYVAVGQWNAWFDSLLYAKSDDLEVMQLLLKRLLTTSNSMSEEMQMYAELYNMEASQFTSNVGSLKG